MTSRLQAAKSSKAKRESRMRIYDIGVGYGLVVLQKAGQGERQAFSFRGLDGLVACGRPAPVVFLQFLIYCCKYGV